MIKIKQCILKKKLNVVITNTHFLNKYNKKNIGKKYVLSFFCSNKKPKCISKNKGVIKVYKKAKHVSASFIKNNIKGCKPTCLQTNIKKAKNRLQNKVNKSQNVQLNNTTKVYKKTQNNQCEIIKKARNKDKKYKYESLQSNQIKYTNVFSSTKQKNAFNSVWFLLIVGCFIGFVNGFWGGGGGMICVPALIVLLKLPEKKAHATAILIMLPLSIASFVVYFINGGIEWQAAGVITAAFVVGGVLGALLLKKINNTVLALVFDLIIIAGAIKILF